MIIYFPPNIHHRSPTPISFTYDLSVFHRPVFLTFYNVAAFDKWAVASFLLVICFYCRSVLVAFRRHFRIFFRGHITNSLEQVFFFVFLVKDIY